MLVLRKFLRDIPAAIGLGVVLFAVFVAIFAYQLAPDPIGAMESNILERLQPPSDLHPFGTDHLGRDLLSRVILGTRDALKVSLVTVTGAILIGVPLGLIAGYRRGFLSEAIMRLTDVMLAVPQLVLALALAQLLKPSLETAMMALTFTYWPFFARTVYAESRRLRASTFIEALEGIGVGPARIVFFHILPNAAAPIIVRATIGMGFIILTAALLGFLGMGATPPEPDWGLAVAESRQFLPEAWWFATFPGLAIFFAVLGFNLLGDGVRDIVDPRLRRSR